MQHKVLVAVQPTTEWPLATRAMACSDIAAAMQPKVVAAVQPTADRLVLVLLVLWRWPQTRLAVAEMAAAMEPNVERQLTTRAMACVPLLWSQVCAVASWCQARLVAVEARLAAVRPYVAAASPTPGHGATVLSLQVRAAIVELRGPAELHFRPVPKPQPIILL